MWTLVRHLRDILLRKMYVSFEAFKANGLSLTARLVECHESAQHMVSFHALSELNPLLLSLHGLGPVWRVPRHEFQLRSQVARPTFPVHAALGELASRTLRLSA